MAKKYENMTESELDAERTKAAEQRQEAAEAAVAIVRELDRRGIVEKVEAMSDSQKQAFAQVIRASGVESEEKTGKIGG